MAEVQQVDCKRGQIKPNKIFYIHKYTYIHSNGWMQGYYLATDSLVPSWTQSSLPFLSMLFASFLQRDLKGMMYESRAAFEALSFMLPHNRRHSFDISDGCLQIVFKPCAVFTLKKSRSFFFFFFKDFSILFPLMVGDQIVHYLKQRKEMPV